MKYYLSLIILVLLVACGNGDKPAKTTNSKSSAPKPIEKVVAAKNESETNSSANAGEQDGQDAPVPKEQLDKAKSLLKSVKDADVEAVDAKKIFKIHCSVCHGFKGNMMINGAKDLTKSKISIEEGVAQVYFGKGLMTPYNGVLKDAELIAVAKYVQTELRK